MILTVQIESALVCGVQMKILETIANVGVPRSKPNCRRESKSMRELNAELGDGEIRWPGTEESRKKVWGLLGEAISLNVCPGEAAFVKVNGLSGD